MITTNIQWEMTDTFGGESNYSWVRRGTIDCKEGEELSSWPNIRLADAVNFLKFLRIIK